MKLLSPLEIIKVDDGSLAIGWVGDRVFYAKTVGGFSVELCLAHSVRLDRAVRQQGVLAHFLDASLMTHYDLLARSALVRGLLGHRNDFTPLVILAWAGGVTSATAAFAAAIGDAATIVTDPVDFDQRLRQRAPLAQLCLDPKTWVSAPALKPNVP